MKINFITPLGRTERRHIYLWLVITVVCALATIAPLVVHSGIMVRQIMQLRNQYAQLKQDNAAFDQIMNEKNAYAQQMREKNAHLELQAKNKKQLEKLHSQMAILHNLHTKGIQIQSAMLSDVQHEFSCLVSTADEALTLMETLNKGNQFGVLEITSLTQKDRQFQATFARREAEPTPEPKPNTAP